MSSKENSNLDRVTRALALMEGESEQIESLAKEALALVAAEVSRFQAIRGSLEAAMVQMEARLREKDAMFEEKDASLQRKDSALRDLEESLNAQILDLKNQLRQKEELLEIREIELKDQLRQKEEMLQQKDGAQKKLERQLGARIRALEERLREKEELLGARDAVMKELRSKIDALSFISEGAPDTGEEGEEIPARGFAAAQETSGLIKPERTARRTESGPKRSRLASLLAPVKKRD